MSIVIERRYCFEAAHFLPKVPDHHKCKRMHGHNYEVLIALYGPIDEVGFVMDFWDLDKIVDPIIKTIDHKLLNDIPGLENPTAEHIACWFSNKIMNSLPDVVMLERVTVYETKNCCATWSNWYDEDTTK